MAKLVEILALEMEEWPEGVTHLTQSNVDREIYDARDGNKEDSVDSLNPRFDTMKSHTEDSYPIVTRAQWQAERDRQKGGEWKRHRGGKCPVPDQTQVEVKFRDGDIRQSHASDFFGWKHGELDDIRAEVMQYRVISQPQAEEVDVKDTTIGTLSYKVEIDTTVASQAIDELAAKWDQVDGPLRWRDTVNELDAYIEEFTREREALINRLAEEGFALLPAMHPVMVVADADMSDWRNWKSGDIVTSITNYGDQFSIGSEYEIESIENETLEMVADDAGDPNGWGVDNFKFIRRP